MHGFHDDGTFPSSDYTIHVDEYLRHAARFPTNAAFLTVIPHGAKPPSESGRRAIVAGYDRASAHMKSIVWVVEGSGFNSAMVRATLTTIALARRKHHAISIVSSIEEGLATLMAQNPQAARCAPVDLAAGVAAFEAVRPRSSGVLPVAPKKARWPWSAAS